MHDGAESGMQPAEADASSAHNSDSGALIVDKRQMHNDAESGIQPSQADASSAHNPDSGILVVEPSEADARSARCDSRACALSWTSWQRNIWNLFMGPSESEPRAEEASGTGSWYPFGWGEEARICPRLSEVPHADKVSRSVPASLKMERRYFRAEEGIYVPAILSGNFIENNSTENIRAAPITSRLSPSPSELDRDIQRKPSSNVSERGLSRTDLGSEGFITSAWAFCAAAIPAMNKEQDPGSIVALGEQTLAAAGTPIGSVLAAELLLSSPPLLLLFLSGVESTFAIALSDLSGANVGCTLQIASVQSTVPLLSAVISSENRIGIHLPGCESGLPSCSVEAPTQTGQPFIIYDLHGRPFAQLQAYKAGTTEVSVNDTTVMIVHNVQGNEFGVKSPGGKSIGISRVQSDAVGGNQLEIRSLPGTDSLLVLVVILTLSLFCHSSQVMP